MEKDGLFHDENLDKLNDQIDQDMFKESQKKHSLAKYQRTSADIDKEYYHEQLKIFIARVVVWGGLAAFWIWVIL